MAIFFSLIVKNPNMNDDLGDEDDDMMLSTDEEWIHSQTQGIYHYYYIMFLYNFITLFSLYKSAVYNINMGTYGVIFSVLVECN